MFLALAGRVDAHQTPAELGAVTCTLAELPGLSAQYARARRASGGFASADPLPAALTPGPAADFWTVAFSVLSVNTPGRSRPTDGRNAVEGVDLPSLSALPCDAGVRARDRVAWSMGMVGYSAREIADVLYGHLTRATLDRAYARAAAGAPRYEVVALLEANWRPRTPTVARKPLPSCARAGGRSRGALDALGPDIASLAQQHRVPPALVHAVIAAESGGHPCVVSRAGAIGLMQLMPATAAALGVDPWSPLENLRGGITYLASMLRAYKEDVRLALIAYNAGPQHADRVRDGRAVAYSETRRYVDAITAFLQRNPPSPRQP